VRLVNDGMAVVNVTPRTGQSIRHGANTLATPTTFHPRGPVANWQGLASSVDGTKLFAAAYDGYLYTSTDGEGSRGRRA